MTRTLAQMSTKSLPLEAKRTAAAITACGGGRKSVRTRPP
jgi:hypothetical protein